MKVALSLRVAYQVALGAAGNLVVLTVVIDETRIVHGLFLGLFVHHGGVELLERLSRQKLCLFLLNHLLARVLTYLQLNN